MKKLALTLCIAGSAIGLTACDTTGSGNVDTAAPYDMERTASHEDGYVASPASDRTFKKMQTK